ncbi:MAG TPA: hypothetical protein VMR28_02315 [Candidatus Saccharimonadales bacterium]|nr:hypothetical protein [Candidatus Saccharimonadales bacterium]
MADAAETPEIIHPENEEYARSLTKLRAIGRLAVEGEEEFTESFDPERQAFADFMSGVREMLKTDSEFRDRLDIDEQREHDIVDGKARDTDGMPIVDMIADGQHISETVAKVVPELRAQAIRDKGYLQTAITVDELEPGETWFALSMEPKKELQKYTKTYKNLGYREGLTYLQWHSKVSETSLVAGSYSIDMSDEETWREIMAEEGVAIPPNESPNTWILHGIKRQGDPKQAQEYVKALRKKYYERRGLTGERHSVSEYIDNNMDVVEGIFKAYYPALSEAVYTRTNNETLQGLATAMLNIDLSKMKGEIRAQLLRVGNAESFDDELGKTMESIIRYAAVEVLRKGLPAFINKTESNTAVHETNQSAVNELVYVPGELITHQYLANHVESGIRAGRSYGGCAGQVELSSETANRKADGTVDDNPDNPQAAYGGLNSYNERIGKKRIDKCVVPTCPTRPRKVWVGGCGVCLERCQKLFNRGKDPTKMVGKSKESDEPSTELTPITSLEQWRQEKDREKKIAETAIAAAA